MALLDETTPTDSAFVKVYAAMIREIKAKCNELEGLITGSLNYEAKIVSDLVYVVSEFDYFILGDATLGQALYILPDPADLRIGIEFKVKKLDEGPNAIVLRGYNSSLIDNQAEIEIALPNEVVRYVSDGTKLWTV